MQQGTIARNRAMMSWGEKFFALRFKQVPSGWVFRGPTTRLFGKQQYYLVNDAQKAELMAAAPSLGLFLTFLGLIGVISPAVAVMFLAAFKSIFGHLPQGFLQQFPITIALVLLVAIAGIAFSRYLDQPLRPIVADLPLTDERITPGDANAALANLLGGSTGRIIWIAFSIASGFSALSVIATTIENNFTLTSGAVYGMITAVCMAIAALLFYSTTQRGAK
jgi:hypothetical protein